MVTGSLASANLAKKYSLPVLMRLGIIITSLGVILMLSTVLMKSSIWLSFFIPITIIYFGLCFVLANASTIAMSHVSDKAHGSAVMNFVNMGLATLAVLSLGFFTINVLLLPIMYMGLCVIMIGVFKYAK